MKFLLIGISFTSHLGDLAFGIYPNITFVVNNNIVVQSTVVNNEILFSINGEASATLNEAENLQHVCPPDTDEENFRRELVQYASKVFEVAQKSALSSLSKQNLEILLTAKNHFS